MGRSSLRTSCACSAGRKDTEVMNIPARLLAILSFLIVGAGSRMAAQVRHDTVRTPATLLIPDALWDGVDDTPHRGWAVLVRGSRIHALGPESDILPPGDVIRIELPGTTLIPGLIEGHSHLFLHPYNEASWDDQVLREPAGERMARAVESARLTLRAGITT